MTGRTRRPVRGYLSFQQSHENGKDVLRVTEMGYDDVEALRRQLHFLASQKDQCSAAVLTLPSDLPFNWMLREPQIPHRPVNHAAAVLRPLTRMQLRVLDHKKFLEALRLPRHREGSAIVAVHEAEGHVSRFLLDIAGGQASVHPTGATPTFECADRTWVAIVCGDLAASQAARLGLATPIDAARIDFLDQFAQGPKPFCSEFF